MQKINTYCQIAITIFLGVIMFRAGEISNCLKKAALEPAKTYDYYDSGYDGEYDYGPASTLDVCLENHMFSITTEQLWNSETLAWSYLPLRQ